VKVFFDHMAKLMTSNELSSRIRFAVRDVRDLRKVFLSDFVFLRLNWLSIAVW
jgi:hypothetical protein